MHSLPPEVLTLAQRGVKLIPLRPNSKLPLLESWQTINNSSDPERLQFWQDKFPGLNWGMVCGQLSGIFALDFDVKNGKDGLGWYQHKLEQHGPGLADTIRVRTPSGGTQNYYQWVPGIGTKKSILAPGVDIQGQGAYVVTPPSVIDGVPYQFEDCNAESDIAPVPSYLLPEILELFHERARPPEPPRSNGETKIPSGQGLRHSFLLHHAGQLLHCGIGERALAYQLLEVNEQKFEEPYSRDEVLRQVRDFYQRWQRNPTDVYNEARQNLVRGSWQSPGKNGKPARLDSHLLRRWLSEVEEREIDWLRSPDVPLGALTLLSGDPGAGKTWLALDLAKQVTDEGGTVLYLTIENPAEEVLKPRFRSLGGDVSKLCIVDGVEFRNSETGAAETRSVTLQDLIILEEGIREIAPLLVVVDPIQSYLGANVDAHRSNETRPVLDGIIRLAQKYRFAPFVLRHCAKNATGKALYRGIGTIDFTAAARSELLAVEMSPGKFAMAHVKSNLGPKGPTREYSIAAEKDGVLSKTGHFSWGQELNLSANDLIAEDRVDHRLEEAEDFLKEQLRDEAQLATDLIEAAKQSGISERTLKRAKAKLKVQAYKRVDRRWQWCMPKSA